MKCSGVFNLLFGLVVLLFSAKESVGQQHDLKADTIRKCHKIPELGYSVFTSDSVLEISVEGARNFSTGALCSIDDQFRLGSVSKTITAFMAYYYVNKGFMRWDTRFFELYPELRATSNAAYLDMTLLDLVNMKTPLISWTYTFESPAPSSITGIDKEQRLKFMQWVLQQAPQKCKTEVCWSNPAYVAVGLMLERATGKSFEILLSEMEQILHCRLELGQPNNLNISNPWGHDENTHPEPPGENAKLNWLAPAGNMVATTSEFTKFLQLNLNGMYGTATGLSKSDFQNIHVKGKEMNYGWRSFTSEQSNIEYSWHLGNPGTFLCAVYLSRKNNFGVLVFANVQSEIAQEGIDELFMYLEQKYRQF